MSGKVEFACVVIFTAALMTVSCSRETLTDPEGCGVSTSSNNLASSDDRIDVYADIHARNIFFVLYNNYGRIYFTGRLPSFSALQKCLSTDQLRNLNDEHRIWITDTDLCIAIALQMDVDLSPDLLANIAALELMDGTWSCVKNCYTLVDPILIAECLKNCEGKDPYNEW